MKILKKMMDKNKKSLIYILLAVGIVLIFTGNAFSTEKAEKKEVKKDLRLETEELLENFLKEIEGAGNVKVFLTLENDGTTDFIKNEEGSVESVNEKSRGEVALFEEQKSPTVRGVAVASSGADNPSVRADIICAVSASLDIDSSKIAVFKRKDR